MNISPTNLLGCLVVDPEVFSDERGFFLETYQKQRYSSALNTKEEFVQDNHSKSKKGVLRGLHFQKSKPQGKLVRVIDGEVFDVAVDIRADSTSFGEWFAIVLSAENRRQLWVPPGFAHGFLTLSTSAEVEYKCTDYYDPNDEGCIIWDDPTLGIEWAITESPVLSKKDAAGHNFEELVNANTFTRG